MFRECPSGCLWGPSGPRDTPRDTPGTLRARRAWETPVAGRGCCKSKAQIAALFAILTCRTVELRKSAIARFVLQGYSRPRIQGPKNKHELCFLKLSGNSRDIPSKIPGYPAQKFGFPRFRRTYRTFCLEISRGFFVNFLRPIFRKFKDGNRQNQAVLQGVAFTGCKFKVAKAPFAARKKGPENCKHEVKLRPPLCRPLKHSMTKDFVRFSPHFSRWCRRNVSPQFRSGGFWV